MIHSVTLLGQDYLLTGGGGREVSLWPKAHKICIRLGIILVMQSLIIYTEVYRVVEL